MTKAEQIAAIRDVLSFQDLARLLVLPAPCKMALADILNGFVKFDPEEWQ
jgi:hypothetical protein